MQYNVLTTNDAQEDIISICNYIKRQFSAPETAKKQVDRIIASIETLTQMPFRFPLYKRKKWKDKGLQFITTANYVIFYYVEAQAQIVYILHVFYGGRNTQKLL